MTADPDQPALTPEALSDALAELFGRQHGALRHAANALPINYDNLMKMLVGKRSVPNWIAGRLAELRRLGTIAAPAADPGDPRAAASALRPHLTELSRRAEAAGWSPVAIDTAIGAWPAGRAGRGT